jgi:hypothetical protein
MSTTHQLAESYRQQTTAITKGFLDNVGDRLNTDIHTRKAYWKAYRKMRAKVYPRGADKNNIVLRFEGMI